MVLAKVSFSVLLPGCPVQPDNQESFSGPELWGLVLGAWPPPSCSEGWRVSGVNSLCAGARDGPSGCGGIRGSKIEKGSFYYRRVRGKGESWGSVCLLLTHSPNAHLTPLFSDPMGVPGRRAMVSALVGLMF